LVYAFKRDEVPLGPDLYYANVASALSLMKTSLYLVTTILFDAFIVSHAYCFLVSSVGAERCHVSFTDASSFGTATCSWFCCRSWSSLLTLVRTLS
jgi:hypothetical protein